MEGKSTKQIQLENQTKVNKLEEQTRKEMSNKKFSKRSGDQPTDEEELLRFLQKTLPNSKAKLGTEIDSKYIVDSKVFDLNYYTAVSPFSKTAIGFQSRTVA